MNSQIIFVFLFPKFSTLKVNHIYNQELSLLGKKGRKEKKRERRKGRKVGGEENESYLKTEWDNVWEVSMVLEIEVN